MDYRNADGSVAEMCGNGVRCLRPLPRRPRLAARARSSARHPRRESAACASTATRSRSTWARPRVGGDGTASVDGQAFAGIAVDVGNPHLACVTDAQIDALDLTRPPGTTRRCSRTG